MNAIRRILCALGLHRWQPSRRFYAGPAVVQFKECAHCGITKQVYYKE
jgi:hypothetical protein